MLNILFALLVSILTLSGCGGGHYVPWGVSADTGIVTNDPNSIPNIRWQTEDQREVLAEQDKAMAGQQQAAAPAQAESASTPVPAPVLAAPARKVAVSLLVPLTGKKADLGQSMLKAAQMALFDIGSTNFELIPRDTKSTKEGAVAATVAAVNSRDDLILGPVFAEDLRAIKPAAAAANIPVISFTTDWTLGDGNTYIMGFLPFTQVVRVMKYAESKGLSRFAVYAPQTEYCDVVLRTLQGGGASVVRTSRYAVNQPDLSKLVEDFAITSRGGAAAGAPDFNALMLPLGGEGLKTLVTLLDANGINQNSVKFIGTGLWDDTSLMTNPLLYGGWFAAPDPKLRADFEKRFEENYGVPPLRLASLAYDATALAAVLARTAPEGEAPYTARSLTNPRGFAGIDGVFRFRPDGLSERGLAVLEMQSGKARVVDPAPTAFVSSGS